MVKDKETDLEKAVQPEDVATVLRNAAQKYGESAVELAVAWQNPSAGKIWDKISRKLERLATEIDMMPKN
jgi:urease accessory protein UreF